MTDHHLQFSQLRSTSQILKKSVVHFTALPFTFISISFLLISFHFLVESGSLLLNFVYNDPSFKSLLTCLDIHHSHPYARHLPTRRQTCHSFLHLTRVGTLDDDLFSSNEDQRDLSLYGSLSKWPITGTPVILSNFGTKLGFSGFVTDNEIKSPEIVRHRVKFKMTSFEFENNEDEKQELEERNVDFQFVYKGLN